METYKIKFEPLGLSGRCRADESLLACAHSTGIGIISLCGGKGNCQSCRVQLVEGTASKPTASELKAYSRQEIKEGWRLACQTYPTSDGKVGIPPTSLTTTQRVQTEGQEVGVEPEPVVVPYQVKLPAPSLTDAQADAERLLKALNRQHRRRCDSIDIGALSQLSPQLRSWGWQLRASVRENELIAFGPWPSRQLGLAVDLGTSKISGYLVDLDSGRTLAVKGVSNPQISYGEDIISRISYATQSAAKATQLQRLAVRVLNKLAGDLCAEVKAKVGDIVDAVLVGNTAMHHLLAGLPVKQLALAPFVPAVSQAIDIKASRLGLKFAPGAYLHLLPNIAAFVGADHTAVLLATLNGANRETTLAIDIGTNTEVSLIDKDKITTTSCASGPAFEGWHIKDGMRAASGAIERLRIVDNKVEYQTIDNAPAIGICGSGILDTVAQLYLAGVLGEGGQMNEKHRRVRRGDKYLEFVLVGGKERKDVHRAIVITQQDVREIQLAKAAIRTGIQALLEANAYEEEKIKKVIIAGAFGTYIDVASAIAIGMLPALPLERFQQVGNAAGTGARLALISRTKRAAAQKIVSGINYIELASVPGFNKTFMQASYLGRFRLKEGKRKAIG
ncbi:MAG: ASKHA domain-containing protein [Chloroflexi bacterium]|nr:ASKHA domain-containing protein [Chloroflexota bacterium]